MLQGDCFRGSKDDVCSSSGKLKRPVCILSRAIPFLVRKYSPGHQSMGLVLAIVAALLWVLYDYGVLTLDDQTLNVWLGLLALSTVLGIGLSWSHVRRKLSGQADMDDVDE